MTNDDCRMKNYGILSLFMGGRWQKTEDRGQISDDRRQKTDDIMHELRN